MRRITDKNLAELVLSLNFMKDSPTETYILKGKKYVAQIGNYHLSWAYGGVALHRIVNTSGGVEDVLSTGHIPKRELYNLIRAYKTGYYEYERSK